jgi:hypothetical protein
VATLDGTGGRERPARAALTLILDRGHTSVCVKSRKR